MFGRKDKDNGPDLGKVQQAVQAASTTHGIRNLTVRQNDRAMEIHGVAENIAAKQQAMKAITQQVGDAAGLVNMIDVARETPVQPMQPPVIPQQSVASSPGLAPQVPQQPQAAASAKTHTVAKGETLTHIAQRYYGKASEYQKIFAANRDQLSDPDKIREGMTLKIPG